MTIASAWDSKAHEVKRVRLKVICITFCLCPEIDEEEVVPVHVQLQQKIMMLFQFSFAVLYIPNGEGHWESGGTTVNSPIMA